MFIILIAVACTAMARTYPMYKQCDPKWANLLIGTSANNTICNGGSALSSVAMALAGAGHTTYHPDTLNTWLKNNFGYIQEDVVIWNVITKLGLTYEGK